MASEELREIVFASGDISATVLPEAGARLHRLRVLGHDLLRTPDDPREHLRMPFFWGAYQMAPWCNRAEARPTTVAGATVNLAPNFRDGTAIHGLVYMREWSTDGHGEFSCSGSYGDGWPWPYKVRTHFEVDGREVRIKQSVHNTGADTMPAGIGLHPWFMKPVEVAIDAALVFDRNSGSRPEPEPVSDKLDRRSFSKMPDNLDATWAALGDPPVKLRWPELGIGATMSVTPTNAFLVAASPIELDAIALEPQTHAPDGLRRLRQRETGALALIEPGNSLNLETRLTFESIPEGRS